MSKSVQNLIRGNDDKLTLDVLRKILLESCNGQQVYSESLNRLESVKEKVLGYLNNKYQISESDIEITYLYLLMMQRLPQQIISQLPPLLVLSEELSASNSTYKLVKSKGQYICSLIKLAEKIIDVENILPKYLEDDVFLADISFSKTHYGKNYDTVYSVESCSYIKKKDIVEGSNWTESLKLKPIMINRLEAEEYHGVNSPLLVEYISKITDNRQEDVPLSNVLEIIPEDLIKKNIRNLYNAIHRDRINWLYCNLISHYVMRGKYDQDLSELVSALNDQDVVELRILKDKYTLSQEEVLGIKLPDLIQDTIDVLTDKKGNTVEYRLTDRVAVSGLVLHNDPLLLKELMIKAVGDFSDK